MPEIDLDGVAPLRRAETRRRVKVIRDYLAIKKPQASDKEAAARSLGLGPQQFTNLLRAWRTCGSPAALAKSGVKAGLARSPRKNGLPAATRAATDEALRELPSTASHREAISAVRTKCAFHGTPPPSDSMVSYLRLAMRKSRATRDGPVGLVIGRALALLPVIEDEVVSLPEIILAVRTEDGSIAAAALVKREERGPDEFAEAINPIGKVVAGPITIGLDDEAIAQTFSEAVIVTRSAASRLLAKVLGRGVGSINLSFGPLASTDPSRALRSRADEPLSPKEALETLAANVSAHNRARGATKARVSSTWLAAKPGQ